MRTRVCWVLVGLAMLTLCVLGGVWLTQGNRTGDTGETRPHSSTAMRNRLLTRLPGLRALSATHP
jgi:ABC-type transporter Mla subunit MlaD